MLFSAIFILSSIAGALAAPTELSYKKFEHTPEETPQPSSIHQSYPFPFHFTSTVIAWASPDKVINNTQVPAPGLSQGYGEFQFGLNSQLNTICYNISIYISGDYSSPATTATHIHEAVVGRSGPPRIAFPNPVPINGEPLDQFSWRRSIGCLTGPFSTGVVVNGCEAALPLNEGCS